MTVLSVWSALFVHSVVQRYASYMLRALAPRTQIAGPYNSNWAVLKSHLDII